MVIFLISVKSVYFNQIFCLLCIQTVSDVGPYQTTCWKNTLCGHWTSKAYTQTWRETAEVVREWIFSVGCAHAWKALLLWSGLTNTAKAKMGYISLPQFWMPY